jgi:hypothetical protein
MTIFDSVARQKRRADQFTYGGVGALIVFGVLGALLTQWLWIGSIAAFIVTMAGSLYRLRGIRCPRCHGHIGYVVSAHEWPFHAPSKARFCPFCGVSFGDSVNATSAA